MSRGNLGHLSNSKKLRQEGQESGSIVRNEGDVVSSDQTVLHFAGRIKNISAMILFVHLVRCLNK